jgi:hypothetical protein
MPSTFFGIDVGADPSATIVGGNFIASSGGNLLIPNPQLGATTTSNTSFSLALDDEYPVGLIHLQNLINISAVTVAAGSFSASSTVPPPGISSDLHAALGRSLFFLLPETQIVDGVDFSITVFPDEVSGVSPAVIGSVGAVASFDPPFSIQTGAQYTIHDLSDVQQVPFGTVYITQRPIQRRIDCTFPYVPDDTQIINGVAHDYIADGVALAAMAGRHLPVVIIPFVNDPTNVNMNAIWGLISTDAQITNQFYGFSNFVFQVTQLV